MSGATEKSDQGGAEPHRDAPELAALARDWMALVETELAAWMTDRETQESWTALMGLWSRGFEAMLRGSGGSGGGPGSKNDDGPDPNHTRHGAAADGAGQDRAAGTASGDAASRADDAERLDLGRRVAALEQRLARLESRSDEPKPDRSQPARPRVAKPRVAKPRVSKPRVGKPGAAQPDRSTEAGAKSAEPVGKPAKARAATPKPADEARGVGADRGSTPKRKR